MTNFKNSPIHVIGGGLAGCEAAWAAASAGINVVLHEMRPGTGTDVHLSGALAELVCSNSFRSDDAQNNAVGLLHEEMRRSGSLVMAAAELHKVPAGSALAVDREGFAAEVTARIEAHPLIEIIREEVRALPPAEWDSVIIATGPLTSAALGDEIDRLTGEDELAFFDAIAPIIYKESINFDICWFQSRYDKIGPGGTEADYINCPLDEAQYKTLIEELIAGDKMLFRKWEQNTPYFDGCLPVEVMAERGFETLRFGPMRPVGLTNPHAPDVKPYAILQLRQDNALGTLYNMVGFQTKLKYGAQKDIFRKIPGLEKAEFARLGGMHRNTYLNSPKLIDNTLRLIKQPRLRFAGQITGVEGYVESAAMGLLSGHFASQEKLGKEIIPPPPTTAMGALLTHISGGHLPDESRRGGFQPMNINFGLFPPVEIPKSEDGKRRRRRDRKFARKQAYTGRALADIDKWQNNLELF